MSKVLIVLTTEYPYGKAESYLEAEKKYWDIFDKVYLCPLSGVRSDNIDVSTDKIEIVDGKVIFSKREKILGTIKALFHGKTWCEIYRCLLVSERKIWSLKELISFTYTGNREAQKLAKMLTPRINQDDYVVLYSYWLYRQAYVAIKLNKSIPQSVVVSRAHGHDVYEERHFGYLPYRQYLINNIKNIHTISDNGSRYLASKWPDSIGKLHVSRLGTIDYGEKEYTRNREKLRIVSCSYCIELKRIDLIIRTLGKMNFTIEWTHIGDGVLYDDLIEMAKNTLTSRVAFNFLGYIPNSQIPNIYREMDFDVFVNTSKTEGIPVSIMEAMSFGIPTIATDVGGTSELVKDGISGILIPENAQIGDLKSALETIRNMPDKDYFQLRKSSREFWKKTYCADSNFRDFTTSLKKLT